MIEDRANDPTGSTSDDYSEIWLRAIRFSLVLFLRRCFAIGEPREILLFTRVISYDGSASPVSPFFCLSTRGGGVDTNLLRGLIFPPVVFRLPTDRSFVRTLSHPGDCPGANVSASPSPFSWLVAWMLDARVSKWLFFRLASSRGRIKPTGQEETRRRFLTLNLSRLTNRKVRFTDLQRETAYRFYGQLA